MKRIAALVMALALFPGPGPARMLPDRETLAGLPEDGGPRYNRLVFEKSPYLLQHATNPVDWYPWGEAAFERARREDRPVFLSIGYSTCHWCHVMERESFEDPEVAALLNRDFVAVKVDREERPDIDQIYMTVCQALTGGGGWPLTILVTPDRKPFFAGTYFPKEARFGRPGLVDLLRNAARLWREKRGELTASADRLAGSLRRMSRPEPGGMPGEEVLDQAFSRLEQRYDRTYGGFGNRPKFPMPHQLRFLVRYADRSGRREALGMATETLAALRRGGIFDHVGFGFHRYSTDREFLLPHFEKMLYDQAGLALAYLDAYRATGDPFFARVAREVFDYVLGEMTDPAGGFHSAQDADSEGEEGRFYVWTTGEVETLLGPRAASWIETYNLRPGGNFRDEATGRPTGRNIPHLSPGARLSPMDERDRLLLYEARKRRTPPLRDDKILTAWNGYMIAALARGGRTLGEPRYTEAAMRAADFVLSRLSTKGGERLLRRFRDGEAAGAAFLDDYAFLVHGLLELYESRFELRHLEKALALNRSAMELFRDEEGGGFLLTGRANEELIAPVREIQDGALPSGNSVMFSNLIRIARLTGETAPGKEAEALLRAFSGEIRRAPEAHAQLLLGLDFLFGPAQEIVITGRPGAEDTKALIDAVRRNEPFRSVILFRPAGGEEARRLAELAPYTKAQRPVGGRAAAYVCEDHRCRAPVTDPDALRALLGRRG